MGRLLRFAAVIAMALGGLVASVGTATAGPIDHSACNTWLRLIDISSAQGTNINWKDVAHSGIYGVYIKTTQATDYVSADAVSQEHGATYYALPWGNYDFAQPTVGPRATTAQVKANAVADARFFVKNSRVSKSSLPPVLDLESNAAVNALSINQIVVWATTWAANVSGLTGRIPTIYTGAYYRWSHSHALAKYPLWVAQYVKEGLTPTKAQSNGCGLPLPGNGGWKGFSVWQYTDAGLIYGVGKGDTDAATPQWWNQRTQLGVVLVVPPNKTPVIVKTPTGVVKTVVNRYPAPVYTLGSKGPKVVSIQKFLKVRGIYHGRTNGFYGTKVRASVIGWERRLAHLYPHAHIKTDGEWGPLVQRYTNIWAQVTAAKVHHSVKTA